MMKTLKSAYFLLLFCVTLILSCGGESKSDDKSSDKINEGLEKLSEGLGEKAKEASKEIEGGLAGAMSQLEKSLEGLGEEGVVKKKPVNFRKLKELLPEDTDGYSRSNYEGESNGMAGFSVSTAKAKYSKDDQIIDVELIDAGGLGAAMMGMAAWSLVEVDKESDNGFERTTTYKGNKAFEKCNRKRCEFSVFVAKRFVMTLKGRNVEMDELHDLADEIGIRNLESMKDDEG